MLKNRSYYAELHLPFFTLAGKSSSKQIWAPRSSSSLIFTGKFCNSNPEQDQKKLTLRPEATITTAHCLTSLHDAVRYNTPSRALKSKRNTSDEYGITTRRLINTISICYSQRSSTRSPKMNITIAL